MPEDLHNDSNAMLRSILSKTESNSETLARLETALWPDRGQKGVLTQHDERLDELEAWRNRIVGALSLIAAGGVGVVKHIFGKH